MKVKIIVEIEVREDNKCGLIDCDLYDSDADGCKLNGCYLNGDKRMKECVEAEKKYKEEIGNDSI